MRYKVGKKHRLRTIPEPARWHNMSYMDRRVLEFDAGDLIWLMSGVALAGLLMVAAIA
jgi:hypothetical protein